MTANEIVTYLLACVDAEQGIKDCGEAIDALSREKAALESKDYQFYHLPQPFTEAPPARPEYHDVEALRKNAADNIVFWENMLKDDRKGTVRSALTGLGRSALWSAKETRYDKEQIEKARKDLADLNGELGRRYAAEDAAAKQRYDLALMNYDQALADYNARTESYRQTLKAADQETVRTLAQETEHFSELKASFEERLSKLYGMGILHERFHNQEACAQLAEYLDMGIAEELGGPDGAYRVYLDDLRTNKIVDAVGQVRIAVGMAADKICTAIKHAADRIEKNQSVMIWQIGNMQESFNSLDSDLKTGLNTIHTTMITAGQYFSRQLADHTRAQQEALRSIGEDQQKLRQTIEVSAFNQYLLHRRDNLDNYMFYVLEDPVK